MLRLNFTSCVVSFSFTVGLFVDQSHILNLLLRHEDIMGKNPGPAGEVLYTIHAWPASRPGLFLRCGNALISKVQNRDSSLYVVSRVSIDSLVKT